MQNNYTTKKGISNNKENPMRQQSKKPIPDKKTTLATKHITWKNN